MKIKIMTIDAIDYVKRNITNLVHYYNNGEDPEIWLKKEMGTQAFVDVPDLEFPDFELMIDNDRPASTDIINIKQMYTNMKDLNDSFASDERLWAGLCHTVFYEYMKSRWGSDLDETKIINNYFLKSTRFYVINGISRLWWYGRKTYSQKFENNFAMLDYMANDLNGYGFTLFGSNWSNSERILSLFFEALFELQSETSRKADRILFNDTIQYTNALCGVYLLDACDDEYIKSKIKAYVLKREKELIVEKENNKINNVRTTGTDRFDNIIKAVNYLGGHGTPKQIFDSVEALTGKKVSLLDKNYISNALKSKNFDGVFIRTKTEKFDGYRVSISYLTKENLSKRKAFVQDCINNLEGTQNMVFNVINAIKKERFTLNEIYAYKQSIKSAFPELDDIEKTLKDGLNSLVLSAIIEKIDNTTYKKTYQFI